MHLCTGYSSFGVHLPAWVDCGKITDKYFHYYLYLIKWQKREELKPLVCEDVLHIIESIGPVT